MDFGAFEDTISKIQGVKHVKVVADEDVIEEIHVIANESRSAKQIVRDIESTLMAILNYKIDRKVISIAQLDDGTLKNIGRLIYCGMIIESTGISFQCQIKLSSDTQEYSAVFKGINTSDDSHKVVAKATVDAVEKVVGQGVCFGIDDVIVSRTGSVEYVNVIMTMLKNSIEMKLIGSSIVRNDVNEAIAKAALDGVNRVIGTR